MFAGRHGLSRVRTSRQANLAEDLFLGRQNLINQSAEALFKTVQDARELVFSEFHYGVTRLSFHIDIELGQFNVSDVSLEQY